MYHLAPLLLSNEYPKINKLVRNINLGGCGVFAEKLYNTFVLCKNKPKLFIMGTDEQGLKDRIEGKDAMGGYLIHIIVKIGKFYYDSNGRYDDWKLIGNYKNRYKNMVLVGVDIKTLEEWNRDDWRWNHRFDRRYIKTIDAKLKQYYEKIKKDLVV